ncbi:hypothetical protein QTN25_002209 [Entamoeba marina]
MSLLASFKSRVFKKNAAVELNDNDLIHVDTSINSFLNSQKKDDLIKIQSRINEIYLLKQQLDTELTHLLQKETQLLNDINENKNDCINDQFEPSLFLQSSKSKRDCSIIENDTSSTIQTCQTNENNSSDLLVSTHLKRKRFTSEPQIYPIDRINKSFELDEELMNDCQECDDEKKYQMAEHIKAYETIEERINRFKYDVKCDEELMTSINKEKLSIEKEMKGMDIEITKRTSELEKCIKSCQHLEKKRQKKKRKNRKSESEIVYHF